MQSQVVQFDLMSLLRRLGLVTDAFGIRKLSLGFFGSGNDVVVFLLVAFEVRFEILALSNRCLGFLVESRQVAGNRGQPLGGDSQVGFRSPQGIHVLGQHGLGMNDAFLTIDVLSAQ